MQSLVVYFTHLSLVLSVRYRLITASRTLQAKGEMCTLQTGKLRYHVINISGRSRGGACSPPFNFRPKDKGDAPPYLKVWIHH